jgi:FixJ family two-component response regulator
VTSLISVVDDDVSIRDSAKSLLRSVGYQVEVFESGEKFLESGLLSETACLILDVKMPGMDGLELQRRLDILQAWVPIIFVTAHDDKINRQLALEGGASEFLQKPVSASNFLVAIATALGNRRACGERRDNKAS